MSYKVRLLACSFSPDHEFSKAPAQPTLPQNIESNVPCDDFFLSRVSPLDSVSQDDIRPSSNADCELQLSSHTEQEDSSK